MKLRVLLATIIMSLGLAGIASASLWSLYNEIGQPLPSIAERAIKAAECGIYKYTGTYSQNVALEKCIRGDGLIGYSVATGYQKTLSTSMTSNQTYVPVSSLTLKDGTTLEMSDLGDKVFLVIEPGKSKEEIVMCTDINTSTLRFTGCTRGLAFSGTAVTAVTANQYAHSAGSVVVMSNVHYTYEQYVDTNDKDQTLNGIKTYTQFPIIATSTALPTTNAMFATKYYVDTVGAGGFTSVNVSTTRGLSVDGSSPEKVGINASTTKGLTFDTVGKLYIIASTTQGISVDVNGLYIDGSDSLTWSGTQTYTGSAVFNGNITAATSTFTSTTVSSLRIGVTSTASLIDGTNANSLHTHTIIATSSGIYSTSSANSINTNYDQVIDCGFAPTEVAIRYKLMGYSNAGSAATFSWGTAIYRGTTIIQNHYVAQNSIDAAGYDSVGIAAATPTVGDAGSTGSLVATVAVSAVSSNNVTVRVSQVGGSSAGTGYTQSYGITCYR